MKNKGVKKMIKTLIILLIVVNIITCLTARMTQGGKLVVSGEDIRNSSRRDKPTAYLIAGMNNQASTAYSLIDFSDKYTVPLDFSLFGFNPINAGDQIDVLCRQEGAVVMGISVGAKAIIYSGIDAGHKVILINPCVYPDTVKLDNPFMKVASILLEVISYGLGWLSVIPLPIGDMGNKYSLALLSDQFFWSMWGSPKYQNISNIKIVLSTEDELLKNDQIFEGFAFAKHIQIETKHGRTGEPKSAPLYQWAIKILLQ